MTILDYSKHIFISYARNDGKEYAAQLDSDLLAAGYQTWRDLRSLNEYQDFSAEIETNIQQASYVVVCITPSIDANPSSFVRRELIYAESKGKPIIPLVFPHATVPTLVNHLTWIPFFDRETKKLGYQNGLKQLLSRLNDNQEPTSSRIIDDPFRDYLNALYDQVVRYLSLTVFSLLTLQSEESPTAVKTNPNNVLPMAFWDMAGLEDKINEAQRFSHLNEAFGIYEGRVLLLGEPGSGKTTTLFAFARDAIAKRLENPTLPLPILVPVTTWDSLKKTQLTDWLAAIVPMLEERDLEHLIQTGHALLLLDGLDELGSERPVNPRIQDGETYDPRQRFMSILPENNQVLMTCRVKDYAEIGQKVQLNGAITLQPLNDVQMQDYLHEIPDLWAALAADHDLREVARTPLLLSLFTYAFCELPEEAKNLHDLSVGKVRDKIFETYVHRRYAHEERRMRAHGDKMPFALQEIYQMLGEVAADNLASWFTSENIITVDDIENVLPEVDSKLFVETVCNLHFMLTTEDNTLRFIHLLLRDYFTMVYASTSIENPDAKIRSKAVIVLGNLKNEQSIEILFKSIKDPESIVRSSAALSLGKLKDVRAVEPLTELLSDTSQYFPLLTRRVCDVAARSLTRIGTPEALTIVQNWKKQQGKTEN